MRHSTTIGALFVLVLGLAGVASADDGVTWAAHLTKDRKVDVTLNLKKAKANAVFVDVKCKVEFYNESGGILGEMQFELSGKDEQLLSGKEYRKTFAIPYEDVTVLKEKTVSYTIRALGLRPAVRVKI